MLESFPSLGKITVPKFQTNDTVLQSQGIMLAHHKSQTKQNNKNGTDKNPNQLIFGRESKIHAKA